MELPLKNWKNKHNSPLWQYQWRVPFFLDLSRTSAWSLHQPMSTAYPSLSLDTTSSFAANDNCAYPATNETSAKLSFRWIGTHLSKITRMVLVEIYSMVVHATSITTTTGVLTMLACEVKTEIFSNNATVLTLTVPRNNCQIK